MNRIALIASLAAGLTLAACSNDPEEESAESDAAEATEAPETTPGKDTPRTDAEGNEIVSEGPDDNARPYGSDEADAPGGDSAGTLGGDDSVSGSAGSAAASGSTTRRPTMQSGDPTAPGARPPAGSKLQKAD